MHRVQVSTLCVWYTFVQWCLLSVGSCFKFPCPSSLGPSTLATLFNHMWPRFCGGDIYSRRKPLFSSFGEHIAVCGSSVRQAVARPRHRQSVCIHNIHVAATCCPSVLGYATMRGHMWLNKVASVLGPLRCAPRLQIVKPPLVSCLGQRNSAIVCACCGRTSL